MWGRLSLPLCTKGWRSFSLQPEGRLTQTLHGCRGQSWDPTCATYPALRETGWDQSWCLQRALYLAVLGVHSTELLLKAQRFMTLPQGLAASFLSVRKCGERGFCCAQSLSNCHLSKILSCSFCMCFSFPSGSHGACKAWRDHDPTEDPVFQLS